MRPESPNLKTNWERLRKMAQQNAAERKAHLEQRLADLTRKTEQVKAELAKLNEPAPAAAKK